MRLIDADALKDAVMDTEPVFDADFVPYQKTHDVMITIDNAPTIEIVRCKECINTEKRATEEVGHKYCSILAGWVDDDFYCSYGEKQTERSESTDCAWK